MSDILVEKLREELKKQRFNYKSLSLASGLGETTVRDIITRRARNPRRDTLQKIAHTLGLPTSYFLDERTNASADEEYWPIPSSALAENIQVMAGNLRKTISKLDDRHLLAGMLKNDDLSPLLPASTTLYYRKGKKSRLESCLGKLCVVKLLQGPLCAGILMPGDKQGSHSLMRHRSKLRHSIIVEWCARVLFITLA